MGKIIQVAELSVYDNEGEVLIEDLSFSLKQGEIGQLSGLTEVQYKTLFDILIGELTPDYGQIVLADRNIVRLSHNKRKKMLRSEVSIFPQDFILPKNKTVLESLRFKLEVTGTPVELEERLKETIEITELRGEENRLCSELQGAKKVQAALALSIVNQPRLLICHRPFKGLNYSVKENLIGVLTEINEQKSLSILLLTDNLNDNIENVRVIESNLDSRVVLGENE